MSNPGLVILQLLTYPRAATTNTSSKLHTAVVNPSFHSGGTVSFWYKVGQTRSEYPSLSEAVVFVLGWKDTFFFFKQKTAYEISLGLVGSEMCIRDRSQDH